MRPLRLFTALVAAATLALIASAATAIAAAASSAAARHPRRPALAARLRVARRARAADGVPPRPAPADRPRARRAYATRRVFSPHVEVRRAPAPQGPWSAPQRLMTLAAPSGAVTYGALVHRGLTGDGSLVLGYSVNASRHAGNYADAGLYRPRFQPLPALG